MNKQRLAVIGAGVSGLTVAQLLKDKYEIKVFEKDSRPGGLIKCERVNGSLFHTCGGHVLNSKYPEVLKWIGKFVNLEKEYVKADRNSCVVFNDGLHVPYPIENHIYLLPKTLQLKCIGDLLSMAKEDNHVYENFEDFLKKRFGDTLFNLYFLPYNKKVWKCALENIPISWLEGKLPMPTVEDIIYNNMNHVEEKRFVHSSFWYPREGGSQFMADRLALGLSIKYNTCVDKLKFTNGVWIVDNERFDKIVFCGNIKQLPDCIEGVDISEFNDDISCLQYHGTTTVFCEIENNNYSWMYLPSSDYACHRVICTGNFSDTNNSEGKFTGTVEFTDRVSLTEIMDHLHRMPYSPSYLAHKYNKYTYPVQTPHTRELVSHLKDVLQKKNFYFTGRFADWEYYNMDVAMKAAMTMCDHYAL